MIPRCPLRSEVAGLAVAALVGVACDRAPQGAVTEAPRAAIASAERSAGAPDGAAPASARSDADETRALTLRARLVQGIADSGPAFAAEPWSRRVLDALSSVPRHAFVPDVPLELAYADRPVPIGLGQTISQPTVVAVMTQALELSGAETVLEIGTGSGYQAAVLSVLARRVYTIELLEPLADTARERLTRLGYANVEVRAGDGYAGWPERAPFDRIIVTAAPPELPRALGEQLRDGGILIAPIGDPARVQELMRYRKTRGRLSAESLGAVRFVPMVEPAP